MSNHFYYRNIAKNTSQVLALTGLKPEEFSALSHVFEVYWQKRMQRMTFEGKPRMRAYKPRKSSMFAQADDRLLFVLSFLKLNPLQEEHGAKYGLHQPKVCLWLGHLLPVLEESLAKQGVLPARTNEQLQQKLREQKTVLMDVTERPVRRSVDNQTQKEHYSGKKSGIPKSI
jgi:hypothetical protein